MTHAIEEYWDILRGKEEDDTTETLPVSVIRKWAQDYHNLERPSFLVLTGSHWERAYRRFTSEEWMFDEPGSVNDLLGSPQAWVHDGIPLHLTQCVREMPVPLELRKTLPPIPDTDVWQILWGLLATSSLVVAEPLDQLIDKRFSLLSDIHRTLNEARFVALETETLSEVSTAVGAIGKWLEGHRHATLTDGEKSFLQRASVSQAVTETERYEVLLFLLTLARQNGVVGGIVLALDGLEAVTDRARADELFKLLEMTERWKKLGSPLGILLGWRGTKEDRRRLKKLHPKLSKRLEDSQKESESR